MISQVLQNQLAAVRERLSGQPSYDQDGADDDLDWVNIMQQRPGAAQLERKELTPLTSQDTEGELAVDVWHDTVTYYIRAAIAGVEPEDLDITVSNDTIGISGNRMQPNLKSGQSALANECHWGRFGRTIVLPSEINPAEVAAQLKNGILLITAPKLKPEGTFRIPVLDESAVDDAFGRAQ